LLAVDKQAREHLIASRQGLSLLADVAAMPAAAFRHQECDEPTTQQQEQIVQGQQSGTVLASSMQQGPVAAGAAASATVVPVAVQPQPGISQAAAGAAASAAAQEPASEQTANASTAAEDTSRLDEGSAVPAAADSVVAEEPVPVPAALLEMQPNQLAAEVLAAVLLRDATARALFMQSGNCRLLLPLLRAPDVRAQLCGVAAVARMSSTLDTHEKCSQLAQQEPQLLRQIHSSIVNLLRSTLLQQHHPNHCTAATQSGGASSSGDGAGVSSSCTIDDSCQPLADELHQAVDSELQDMLLEYSCLALWVATAAVAPLFTKDEVLQQIADAGQLAHACLQLHGPGSTPPSVVCCLAGVLCVLAATKAVPEAAAELPVENGSAAEGSSEAAALVQALQPFLLAVLQLDGVKDEVRQMCNAGACKHVWTLVIIVYLSSAVLLTHTPDNHGDVAALLQLLLLSVTWMLCAFHALSTGDSSQVLGCCHPDVAGKLRVPRPSRQQQQQQH
jgi:hypothetical protein